MTDENSKQKKRYTYKNIINPCEKLKSLPNTEQYLKTSIAFILLDDSVLPIRYNDYVRQSNEAKRQLFKKLSLKRKTGRPLASQD